MPKWSEAGKTKIVDKQGHPDRGLKKRDKHRAKRSDPNQGYIISEQGKMFLGRFERDWNSKVCSCKSF